MAVYAQVAKTLEEEIRSQLSSGDFLPSESELAKRFSVNRHTVRRAVDELARAGMVLRQHGKGTMVVDSKIEYSIGSRARFSETLESIGLHSESRVIAATQGEASKALARRMHIAPGTQITQIDTLRYIDKNPVCIISHHLVPRYVPGIIEQFKHGSLHEFIAEHYGCSMQRKECVISARLPEVREAMLLHCARQLPLLEVQSINVFDQASSTFEYSVSRSRSDVFEMKLSPIAEL